MARGVLCRVPVAQEIEILEGVQTDIARAITLKLRPSELDRAIACPASLYPREDEILIRSESGDAAAVGSAVHAVLAHVARERLTQLPDVEPFAIAEDVPDKEEEIRILSHIGLKWMNEHPATDAAVETLLRATLGEIELRGTADRITWVQQASGRWTCYIDDYKTGQKSDAGLARQQMTAYGYLAFDSALDRISPDTLFIIRLPWLRDQEVSVLMFTPAELVEWAQDLPRRVAWDGQTYTPGDACRWCPRVAECPGRARLYRASIEALSDTTELVPYEGQLPADPTAWGRAIQQARLLKGLIDDFLKASVTAVEVAGGEVALPTGQKIILKSRAGSASLDPATTIQRLRAMWGLSDEELVQFVSVKKTGVEKFIGAHAERGEKGKLIEATLAQFEEDGILKRGAPARWVDIVSSEEA